MKPSNLLLVEDLTVVYETAAGCAPAVRSLSLQLERGETLGIVGELGSGKSTLAYALIGYLAPGARLGSGTIRFQGEDLLRASKKALTRLRGKHIAMVHQHPHSALNPALRVGTQLAQVMQHHAGISWRTAKKGALDYLSMVNLPDPRGISRRYPHELSGGQCQRVAIAIAICMEPDLLILDEPTTSLDVTTEAVILDLLRDVKKQVSAGIVYISHNLGVVAQMADRVAVMYAGELVEEAPTGRIFRIPSHPYTRALLDCIPRPRVSKRSGVLEGIPGSIPRITALPRGCVFEPRCRFATSHCLVHPDLKLVAPLHSVRCIHWERVASTQGPSKKAAAVLEREAGAPFLRVRGLRKSYNDASAGGVFGRRLQAVAGVDIDLPRDGILGLVGESGSGKSTLLRCIAGLARLDAGTINLSGEDIGKSVRQRNARILRQLQVVFQDPESTLNPKYTVGSNLTRHLKCLMPDVPDPAASVAMALQRTGLDPEFLLRYPDELSGGQKQRVAIARAFLGRPNLVLCDEPLSALDVSVQASILQLLLELQAETAVSYLLISHDLTVVRYIADTIAVMYLGRIFELGGAESFDHFPLHPYSEALLSAQSVPEPMRRSQAIRLQGTIPNPANPPSGCVFHTRCHRKIGVVCENTEPPWQDSVAGRRYRCHIKPDDLAVAQTATLQSMR